jgi:hypothetical protein
MRECLIHNGVKLLPGSLAPEPESRTAYQAALGKCGAHLAPATPGKKSGTTKKLASRFTRALTAFAGCMRSSGIPLGAPNTSGSGPIFNTKGIDTRSAAFQAALAKCRGVLRAATSASPGAGSSTP